MREAMLDSQSGLYLAEPLDTWLTAAQQDFAIPEAGGSSARVFLLKNALGKTGFGPDPAFKVMRHDKIAYAKPLFLEEFNILAGLHVAGKVDEAFRQLSNSRIKHMDSS